MSGADFVPVVTLLSPTGGTLRIAAGVVDGVPAVSIQQMSKDGSAFKPKSRIVIGIDNLAPVVMALSHGAEVAKDLAGEGDGNDHATQH
jgi:hypothetical protein